ncbi:hypothetical protein NEHOM01_0358 [Nematocida homosporus]|uniref:uncharacterized protein n=1 Tax=Nematocida homosporus TaxID=1912981 RepID=UPI00221EA0A2|nr:uncharacterized protein NEHOM01_0358 [Nematocida homosporus]KAI5184756.1 hypothetical protein NEHOM01_0358 [Nematocida homosporus]
MRRFRIVGLFVLAFTAGIVGIVCSGGHNIVHDIMYNYQPKIGASGNYSIEGAEANIEYWYGWPAKHKIDQCSLIWLKLKKDSIGASDATAICADLRKLISKLPIEELPINSLGIEWCNSIGDGVKCLDATKYNEIFKLARTQKDRLNIILLNAPLFYIPTVPQEEKAIQDAKAIIDMVVSINHFHNIYEVCCLVKECADPERIPNLAELPSLVPKEYLANFTTVIADPSVKKAVMLVNTMDDLESDEAPVYELRQCFYLPHVNIDKISLPPNTIIPYLEIWVNNWEEVLKSTLGVIDAALLFNANIAIGVREEKVNVWILADMEIVGVDKIIWKLEVYDDCEPTNQLYPPAIFSILRRFLSAIGIDRISEQVKYLTINTTDYTPMFTGKEFNPCYKEYFSLTRVQTLLDPS